MSGVGMDAIVPGTSARTSRGGREAGHASSVVLAVGLHPRECVRKPDRGVCGANPWNSVDTAKAGCERTQGGGFEALEQEANGGQCRGVIDRLEPETQAPV